MVPLIADLRSIDVRFGRVPVLRDLTFELPPGAVIGVVGPNGSGKTTLLRVLATLLRPTRGSGTVLGAGVGTADIYDVRARIGLIGHRPALYGELTLRENLEFVAAVQGGSREAVAHALQAAGLEKSAGRRADHASWGMQRRVEFARLLMTAPDLLLLDEPQAGLDVAATDLVGAVVDRARSRQGSVVLASHEIGTLSEIADHVHELREGTLTFRDGVRR